MSEEYIGTFTTFGGADLVLTVGSKMIGEAQSVNWEEDFLTDDEYKIKGVIDLFNFGAELPVEEFAKKREQFNIVMTYANEFGHCFAQRIYGCMFTKRAGKTDIDDLIISQSYSFKGKKIEILTEKQLREQGIILRD